MSESPYAGFAETHIGAVVFVGDRAYKLKKPVNMGFLDFGDRESRRWACQREYELNRRLAPDAYLGVSELPEPGDDVGEPVLVMRRFAPERSLVALIESGAASVDLVREIATLLARFHTDASRGPRVNAQGTADAVRARWQDNLDGLRPFRSELLDAEVLDEIEHRALTFIAGRGPLFEERIERGCVLDGHGDLLAQDIFCLDDGPRILDCIEFDDELRYLDGMDDAACLAMDLEYRGACELAASFLQRYRESRSDAAPESLRHHYTAYRAVVRAKVACLRHEPGDERAAADARQHAALALSHLRAATPRVILVGGLPGTGKSTVAGELAERLGAELLASDTIRRETVESPEDGSSGYQSGRYSHANVDTNYREVVRRGEKLLAAGYSVVLDASWTRERHRTLARDAATRVSAELIQLECVAVPGVAEQRIRERGPTESDADPSVARAMAEDADPWPQATSVHTEGAVRESMRQARDALGLRDEEKAG